jgi:hypothetical protein
MLMLPCLINSPSRDKVRENIELIDQNYRESRRPIAAALVATKPIDSLIISSINIIDDALGRPSTSEHTIISRLVSSLIRRHELAANNATPESST